MTTFPSVQREVRQRPREAQQDIQPKAVKQRHIAGVIIFVGLAVNRPGGTTEIQAYFATDTNTLSLFNGVGWVSVLLT